LFSPEASYDELARRFAAGQQIKKTKITQEFTLDQFRERYGDRALLLFVKNPLGELKIAAADKPLKPEAGDTVFALVQTAANLN
jgi:hypothetical protein